MQEHIHPVGKECLEGGSTSARVDSIQLWGNQRAAGEGYKEFVYLAVHAQALAVVGLLNGHENSSRIQKILIKEPGNMGGLPDPLTGTAWWAGTYLFLNRLRPDRIN